MGATAQYEPLKTIVSYVLDANDKSMGDFDKAWILGFRGLHDLNYNISAEPKTVRIPVLPNKTAPLPSDYLAWSKIGVLNSKGEITSIKVNNSLSTFRDTNPNRISDLTPDVNDNLPLLTGNPFYLNYYYNGMYQTLFGVGGGMIQFGECRFDERNGVIILNEDFRYDSVLLEYISAPQKDDDFMVESSLREAVIAFIEWKMKLAPEKSYYDRAIEARRRLPGKKVTLQNINDAIRHATGFYLKS